MTSITQEVCKEAGVKPRDAERSKNFFALGLVSWLYTRPIEPTLEWITERFGAKPQVVGGQPRAFRAGFDFGETAELFESNYEVKPATFEPGEYVQVTGNSALAWGLDHGLPPGRPAAVPRQLPDHPASDILHELSRRKEFGVRTFQAEDEIAGIGAALGAAFGGSLGVTTTSGPGLDLKSETIGLAINLELPLVIVDVQRGGPSTGLPTKTEQADLLHAMYGRHGEAPLPIIAPQNAERLLRRRHRGGAPGRQVPHAGDRALRRLPGQRGRAVAAARPRRPRADRPRLRLRAEPHRRRRHGELLALHPGPRDPGPPVGPARPARASSTASAASRRPTAAATSPTTGVNHERMVHLRRNKIAGIAADIPPLEVNDETGDAQLLLVSWGSTYAAVAAGVKRVRARGMKVAHAHLRYLNPFPSNLGEVLDRYTQVLVPEINLGQLSRILRADFLVDAQSYQQGAGRAVPCAGDRGSHHLRCSEGSHDRANSNPTAVPVTTTQGLDQRPGGALVPGLRRLLHPGRRADADARPRRAAGEHGLPLRHRLRRPLPVLHEHLRHALDPRAGAGHRHRLGHQPARPRRLGRSPATATPSPSAATT